jgi:hypothetical protein
MGSVKLQLEGFAGSEIDTVLTDAVHVAQRVGAWVDIDVNGIHVLISPSDLPAQITKNYWAAQERGAKFVSANVIPTPAAQRASKEGREDGV